MARHAFHIRIAMQNIPDRPIGVGPSGLPGNFLIRQNPASRNTRYDPIDCLSKRLQYFMPPLARLALIEEDFPRMLSGVGIHGLF